MDERPPTAPVRRVVEASGVPEILDVLAERLSGADLTSLMLEVYRRRAAAATPPELLRRYASDRFSAPAGVPLTRLRAVEDVFLRALPGDVETLELSPLLPLGSHSVFGAVDQNNVVAAVRGHDVAADPTNGLAFEAAVRRRRAIAAGRPADALTLATSQRVVRAQRFSGPMTFAHFTLFALVTMGRDPGGRSFERSAAARHVGFHARALLAAGAEDVRVEISDFTGGRLEPVCEAVEAELGETTGVHVHRNPDRPDGRRYYAGFRFGIGAAWGAEAVHVTDGGLVDWGRHLVGSRKERVFTSASGLDRVAVVFAPDDPRDR